MNNASLPEKYEGNWSIRVFSDGGYRLHERKDFQVKAQTVASQPLDETDEKPGRGRIRFAALFGLFLLLPGLPLLIIGSISTGGDNLAMIIPGAILTGIGGFLAVGAWFVYISSRGRSNAESGKPAPARKDPKAPAIEVLEAIEGKPIRFRINDSPSGGSAWVGIYPFGVPDEDHGEEGERWNWLRDIDVTDASFPERRKGTVSIRVFSGGGHALHSREDFEIAQMEERWWED